MYLRRVAVVAGLLVAVAVIGTNPGVLVGSYDTATVEAVDADTDETLATVEVRVADGPVKRYVGLSATDELAPNEGMLFVHADRTERAYVMRDMAFPIDIVFAEGDGTITRIHGAEPESRPYARYEGTGRYVLEVPRGWSERHGVAPGDRLAIETR